MDGPSPSALPEASFWSPICSLGNHESRSFQGNGWSVALPSLEARSDGLGVQTEADVTCSRLPHGSQPGESKKTINFPRHETRRQDGPQSAKGHRKQTEHPCTCLPQCACCVEVSH
ncbi:PREDICTED: uncharacterized protein LOC109377090 isoform X2 [Hipposideros armiger]|uniref:Uncharacterized protein LOC109377090 isoform X2 n=1 Tax=Hipposideros armiger TaxID=186990 RepID=A0A8B7QL59_HIPAR|nr:PREDICTED: uncharacterized protein LOC109377090 isoform X2 [Hipposideros armiger]